MHKIFAEKFKNNNFYYYEEDITHLIKILRFKLNDEFLTIYDSKRYLVKITSLEPFRTSVIKELNYSTNIDKEVHLFQAVIKPKHMEWILSKSVELQINKIYSVLFKRSNKNNLISEKRTNQIIKSASEQSNRDFIINNEFIEWNTETIKLLNEYDLVILAYEKEDKNNYLKNIDLKDKKKIAILIGPEGGFDIEEIKALSSLSNIEFVKLTNSILRSETASFYLISNLINKVIEDK